MTNILAATRHGSRKGHTCARLHQIRCLHCILDHISCIVDEFDETMVSDLPLCDELVQLGCWHGFHGIHTICKHETISLRSGRYDATNAQHLIDNKQVNLDQPYSQTAIQPFHIIGVYANEHYLDNWILHHMVHLNPMKRSY